MAGDVAVAGGWVARHTGLPNPVLNGKEVCKRLGGACSNHERNVNWACQQRLVI